MTGPQRRPCPPSRLRIDSQTSGWLSRSKWCIPPCLRVSSTENGVCWRGLVGRPHSLNYVLQDVDNGYRTGGDENDEQ